MKGEVKKIEDTGTNSDNLGLTYRMLLKIACPGCTCLESDLEVRADIRKK